MSDAPQCDGVCAPEDNPIWKKIAESMERTYEQRLTDAQAKIAALEAQVAGMRELDAVKETT